MRLHRSVVILVLALSACGGGGEGDGDTTRAEFISNADALCKEHNQKLDQATEQLVSNPPPLSQEELDAFVEDYGKAYGDMADDLAELETPSGDEAVEKYLDRIQRTADGLEEADGHSDAVQQALQNSTREASALAQDAGLKVCSSSPEL
jgi:hypothetical protein